jgi:hypothetical protein
MTYCTLEEAWGSDFKKRKKTRKERKLEKQEKKMLDESIDPNILIPKTNIDSNYRKDISENDLPKSDESNIFGYDDSFNQYSPPYLRYNNDQVISTNENVLNDNKIQLEQGDMTPEKDDIIYLTKQQYDQLINDNQRKGNNDSNMVEGFINTSDNQFNQLILYIFAGIFYLLMLDMMYQLGKKSY